MTCLCLQTSNVLSFSHMSNSQVITDEIRILGGRGSILNTVATNIKLWSQNLSCNILKYRSFIKYKQKRPKNDSSRFIVNDRQF